MGAAMGLALFLALARLGSGSVLRENVAALASRGRFDSALALVDLAPESPGLVLQKPLLTGKLLLRGDKAAKAWQSLRSAQSASPEQAEALYLLGQYHYAAGRYHLAIPEFREYFRRYPRGEDADRAGYWMANACLHLALTQSGKGAYLDSGLAYLDKMPEQSQGRGYYAAMAAECRARLWLAYSQAGSADSVLQEALPRASHDEKPALLLLQALALRSADRPYAATLAELNSRFPKSPEASYALKFKGKLPKLPSMVALAHSTAASRARDGSFPSPASSGSHPSTSSLPASGKSPGGSFSLQVGSFARSENAQALVNKLGRMGIKAQWEPATLGGKPLTQVWLGPFTSAEEAEGFGEGKLKPLKILYQVRRRD